MSGKLSILPREKADPYCIFHFIWLKLCVLGEELRPKMYVSEEKPIENKKTALHSVNMYTGFFEMLKVQE